MERYYQPEIEQASREQIKAWQDERLVEQVRHVYANVPYYKKLMDEKGVTPADIKSSDDLYKLPFLTKSDLRQAYPYGQTLEAYRSTPGEKRLVGHWCLNLVDSPRVELALITWKEHKNNAGQETGTAT